MIRILDTQLLPTQSPSLATAAQNVIEADTSLIFNNRSIGSIIKSYGAMQFNQYLSLEKDKKSIVAFYLNGIIDHYQYSQLFTKGEWKMMEKLIKLLYKITKSDLEILRNTYPKAIHQSVQQMLKKDHQVHREHTHVQKIVFQQKEHHQL